MLFIGNTDPAPSTGTYPVPVPKTAWWLLLWSFGSLIWACKETVTSPFHGKSFFWAHKTIPNSYRNGTSWAARVFHTLKKVGWRAASNLFDFRHAKALQKDYPRHPMLEMDPIKQIKINFNRNHLFFRLQNYTKMVGSSLAMSRHCFTQKKKAS